MEKHAVDKISVIVDTSKFEIIWSGLWIASYNWIRLDISVMFGEWRSVYCNYGPFFARDRTLVFIFCQDKKK